MKIQEQEWRKVMSKNEVNGTVVPQIQKKRRLPRPDEIGQLNERLRSERVELELKSMPGWRLLPNGWELGMTRRLPGAGGALSFAGYARAPAGGAGGGGGAAAARGRAGGGPCRGGGPVREWPCRSPRTRRATRSR